MASAPATGYSDVEKGGGWLLFGRWFGIGVAGLNAIAALLSIPAYPFWSLAVFTIDIVIIYGLSAYGGSRGRSGLGER
jgi:hypothetical protein